MAFRFSRKNGPRKVEKIRLRKGDLVEVLTGKDRSKRGKILEVNRATGRVIVQGVSMIKRHTRPNPQRNIKGGIAEREGSIHASNVLVVSSENNKRSRLGSKVVGKTDTGKDIRARVAIKTGEVLDK
jgi:large subunit ribosomal protein L24